MAFLRTSQVLTGVVAFFAALSLTDPAFAQAALDAVSSVGAVDLSTTPDVLTQPTGFPRGGVSAETQGFLQDVMNGGADRAHASWQELPADFGQEWQVQQSESGDSGLVNNVQGLLDNGIPLGDDPRWSLNEVGGDGAVGVSFKSTN